MCEFIVLQMTYRAMDKFIMKNDDQTRAGMYLRKLWAKCMIRRTYASSIGAMAQAPGRS